MRTEFDVGETSAVRELLERAGLERVPPQAMLGVLAVAIVACGWALWRWRAAPSAVDSGGNTGTIAFSEPTAVPSGQGAGADAARGERIAVHVTGAVRHPGLYEFAPGERVVDAVAAAGGMLPDAVESSVNLARRLIDGEQIHVPDADDAERSPPAAPARASGRSGAIDINTATAEELEALPGVGPVTAAKIVAEREENGPFASVDDLERVPGIGPKRIEQLRDAACVR